MSNKNLNIQQWATVASASTPDAGYKKLYPKSGESNWYSIDDDGTHKLISPSVYFKNGLSTTSLGSGNQYGSQVEVVIGTGLSFSSNAPGSSIRVANLTASHLSFTGTATPGYMVKIGTGGVFDFTPVTFPGISGSNNFIPKFTSTTTISDSRIVDDGTYVRIGTLPTFAQSLFNVNGSASFFGPIYLSDSVNSYFKYDGGFRFETIQNFKVTNTSTEYLRVSWDGVDSYSFSILDDSLYLTRMGTSSMTYSLLGPNLDVFQVGTTTSNNASIRLYGDVNVSSSLNLSFTGSALRISDGSEAADRVLFSNSTGYTTWRTLGSGLGITISGWTISVNNGLGLTFGSGKLVVQNGDGLTFSGNSLVVNNGPGLTFSSGKLTLNLGSGLTFSGETLNSNITNGLTNYYISATGQGYTGTSSETILKTVMIPGGVVQQYNMVEVEFRIYKSGGSSSWTPSLRVGTNSNTLGLPIMTPSTLVSGASNGFRYFNIRRNLLALSATNSTEFFPDRSRIDQLDSEWTPNNSDSTSYAGIDWTVNQWVQVCSTMGATNSDYITASALQVKVWKQ